MLKIGVCDDDEKFAFELEGYILKYAERNNFKVDTQTFTQAQDLINYIKFEDMFDILFLDIELGKVSGVDIGKYLRSDLDIQGMQIVFVSVKENYAMQLFDVHPLNFLIKPIKYKKIEQIMSEYGRLYKFQCNYFEYSIRKEKYMVDEQSILYFQSCGKKIYMVTQRDKKEFYGKLSDVFSKLNSFSFCTVHKSYIVNMKYISEYCNNSVLMVNGDIIPVSRAMKDNLSRKIIENKWGNMEDACSGNNI